ncbi:MAG: HigA family addiction module antidote protein [Treponema sp.]|jgi:addiction module HigA family antidote|nr:HigA family addiction module antidote protein [Treponema sp.]
MAKEQSPGAVFKSFMDQYDLTAAKIAGDIKLSQSSIRLLIGGKLKISVPIALRLSKYFGTKPEYWTNLQIAYELAESAKNPKLAPILKAIPRAKKGEAPKKPRASAKTGGRTAAKKTTAKKPAARKPAGRTSKPRSAN